MTAIEAATYHLLPCSSVCHWCGKKCACGENGSEPTIIGLDPVGWICEECHIRACPPHDKYLHELLGVHLNLDKHITDTIVKFSFPVCTAPFNTNCFKCDLQVEPGSRCPVCKRMFTGGQPVWNFITLYDDDIVNKRKWQLWQRPIPGAPLLPMGRWATRNDVPLQGLWDRPYVGRWSPATWNSGGTWEGSGGGGSAYGGGGWSSGDGRWMDGWDWREERGWTRRGTSVLDRS